MIIFPRAIETRLGPVFGHILRVDMLFVLACTSGPLCKPFCAFPDSPARVDPVQKGLTSGDRNFDELVPANGSSLCLETLWGSFGWMFTREKPISEHRPRPGGLVRAKRPHPRCHVMEDRTLLRDCRMTCSSPIALSGYVFVATSPFGWQEKGPDVRARLGSLM